MRKLFLVPLLSFQGRTVFEKDLRFVKLARDFKNTPKAKFQNQWSFRISYHSGPETLISTLLSEITTFVNTKVCQLTDLTDPLSVLEIIWCKSSINHKEYGFGKTHKVFKVNDYMEFVDALIGWNFHDKIVCGTAK